MELTLTGDVLRKIPLVGWSNPEGVAVMNDGLIAITDERQHKLTIVKVNADTTTLNIADFPSMNSASPPTRTRASKASPGTRSVSS